MKFTYNPQEYRPSSWKFWELAAIYLLMTIAVAWWQLNISNNLSAWGFIQDDINTYISGMYFQFVCLLFLVGIFIRRKRLSLQSIGLRQLSFKDFLFHGVLTGFGLGIFMLIAGWLIAQYFPNLAAQPFEAMARQAVTDKIRMGLLIVGAVVCAPFGEELLFRGLIYDWLRQYLKPELAYLAGGLVFGILHFDAVRLLPITIGGLVLCRAYEKTGSLWVNITAHAIWNGSMIVILFLSI